MIMGNLNGYLEYDGEIHKIQSVEQLQEFMDSTSGEKYGYYNGYSDDVIDDAFDGCPEATWNVD